VSDRERERERAHERETAGERARERERASERARERHTQTEREHLQRATPTRGLFRKHTGLFLREYGLF